MRSIAAALIITALLAVPLQPAHAGDGVRHDRRVERAAAQIAAAKIGDLRGSHAHDADPMALIETYKRPLRLKDRPEPAPVAVPPLVLNGGNAGDPSVDRVVTGSIRLY
jgi:hypothetical protein